MGELAKANPSTMRSAIAATERRAKLLEDAGDTKGADDEWDRAVRLRRMLDETIKPKRTIRWR